MRIVRSHKLGIDEAKSRLGMVADDLRSKLSLTYRWRDDVLVFSGSGVDGRIHVTNSSINILAEFGFALMLVESSIRNEIEKVLDHHLAVDS